MPKGWKGWAVFAVAQAVLTGAWKLLYKLVENAVIGWGDDQIAHLFGITSPRFATAFAWVIPFALAVVTIYLYHQWNKWQFLSSNAAVANEKPKKTSIEKTVSVPSPDKTETKEKIDKTEHREKEKVVDLANLVATARFLYDRKSGTLTLIDKQDLEVVTIDRDYQGLVLMGGWNDKFVLRFVLFSHSGPFVVTAGQDVILSTLEHVYVLTSVIENKVNYVKIQLSFIPPITVGPNSFEFSVKIYRR